MNRAHLTLFFLLAWSSGANAHQVDRGTLHIDLQSSGEVCGDLAIDAARVAPTLNDVRVAIQRGLELRFDGTPVELDVQTIALGNPGLSDASGMHHARACGVFSRRAQRMVVRSNAPLGALHVAIAFDHTPATSLLLAEDTTSPAFVFQAADLGAGSALRQYVALGCHHILPLGTDHIAFVLGLLLVTRRLRELVNRITAFTIGHSLTLLAAAHGVVQPAASWVEPAIALSIVWIALAALRSRQALAHGAWLVGAVGMVHGLGFASVLEGVGLAPGQFAVSLFGFNLGVELGQLAIVLCVWPVLHWAGERDWFRGRVVVPAAAVLAMLGSWWFIARISA